MLRPADPQQLHWRNKRWWSLTPSRCDPHCGIGQPEPGRLGSRRAYAGTTRRFQPAENPPITGRCNSWAQL